MNWALTVSSKEPSVIAEDDNGSDNSQFTGSTINLQDLEWPPEELLGKGVLLRWSTSLAPGHCPLFTSTNILWDVWFHQTIASSFPRTLTAFLDTWLREFGEGVDTSPQIMHLEKRRWGLFVQKIIMCLILKSSLYQNQTWEHCHVKDTCDRLFVPFYFFICFDCSGVYSMVPHCHSCTHSALSTLQLPYRHLTLCIPPPAGYLLHLWLFWFPMLRFIFLQQWLSLCWKHACSSVYIQYVMS